MSNQDIKAFVVKDGDEKLDAMFLRSTIDDFFAGSEIRVLIGEIRRARITEYILREEIADLKDRVIKANASSLTSTQRVCAKCGCETKGEEALVSGEIWCHPCADTVSPPPAHRGDGAA